MNDEQSIIEQYKIAIKAADKNTDRRYNFNKFMIMICTALIGGVCALASKNPYLTVPIAMIGVFICKIWEKQINCFKTMVHIKYKSVKNIEKENDKILKTYNREYDEREKAKKSGFKSFSEQEKNIAETFKYGFIVYILIIFIMFITKFTPSWLFLNLLFI